MVSNSTGTLQTWTTSEERGASADGIRSLVPCIVNPNGVVTELIYVGVNEPMNRTRWRDPRERSWHDSESDWTM